MILRKISKFDATGCQILRLKCTKFDFHWGYAPDPVGGAYSAPPDPLAVTKGAHLSLTLPRLRCSGVHPLDVSIRSRLVLFVLVTHLCSRYEQFETWGSTLTQMSPRVLTPLPTKRTRTRTRPDPTRPDPTSDKVCRLVVDRRGYDGLGRRPASPTKSGRARLVECGHIRSSCC